jgi:LacI family transcriptional regulator
VQAIQQTLASEGMTLLISDTGGNVERVPVLARTLREHRVEGLFYVAKHHMPVDLPLAGQADRLVLVNAFDAAGSPCVVPDDRDGQRQLVAAVIAAGHRRIGFLTLATQLVAYGLRLEGYRRALEEAGIDYDPALVIDADRDGGPAEREALDAAIDQLLALDAPPTVLCCGNDRLAVTVYGLLRARDITVPEQMSVAGYDDYRVISETLYPQLTTMELPYARMGETAARLMLGELRGGAPIAAGARIEVPGALRWRDSVRPGPARPDR